MRQVFDIIRLLFMFFIGSTIIYFAFAGIITIIGLAPFPYSHTMILILVMAYEVNRIRKKKKSLV